MKILVLNAGSSSLKCQYFIDRESIVTALIERIGEKEGKAILHYQHQTFTHEGVIPDHHSALILLDTLFKHSGALEDFSHLNAIGHRVVHGGEYFSGPIQITPSVRETIEKLIPLAPLHNPANLEGINAFSKTYPDLLQVAVFDTAFHQTLPAHAYHYAIPLILKKKYAIRRYGFHGTSHSYVSKMAAKLLAKPIKSLNLITLHLGNGASAAAIQGGKSIDTSMGMTPLEGLMMGTRSGDIDPAIIPYLTRNGYDISEVDHLLNKESGLKGICGTNDMREIITLADKGNEDAKLALEMFVSRIVKYIGGYAALLGNVDAIVFTGGIGEYAVKVREMVCEKLLFFDIDMNKEKNVRLAGEEGTFHTEKSRTALLVIPTNEELEIAFQTEVVAKGAV